MFSIHLLLLQYVCTFEPPNKGHVGNTILYSAILSIVEKLSSLRGSQCIKTIGKIIFLDFEQCPL